MSEDLEKTMEIMEQRVLLLGLYKKKDEESFKDIVLILEQTGLFRKKDGKKYLKNLKSLKFITDDGFTMAGIEKAKEIEMEFKL